MDICTMVGILSYAVACSGEPICHVDGNRTLCGSTVSSYGPPIVTYDCVRSDGSKYQFEAPYVPLGGVQVGIPPS